MSKAPLIIYIIGDQRSGSTLLDYLLSFHPDSHSVGELHNLSGFYHKTSEKNYHNWSCSCGESVRECYFWSSIIEKSKLPKEFQTRIDFRESKLSYLSWGFFNKILDKSIENLEFQQKGKNVAENCWKIYQEISQQTGKSIIIDSSKNAFQAYFLSKYSKGNIWFLLLERDVDAVAYSKLNRIKKIKPRQAQSIYAYIFSSYKMKCKNRILANRIERESNKVRVKRINYTDLALDPEGIITEIVSFLQISTFTVPTYTNEKRCDLHTIGGSPSRYKKRKIEPDLRYLSYYRNKPLAWLLKNILN